MPTTVSDDKIINAKAAKRIKQILDGKSDSGHTHDSRYYTESEVDTMLGGKVSSTEKGAASGVATLDSNGHIPSTQLPAGGMVNAVATGASNGTISVTTNGTAASVSVYGLKDGAFSEVATTEEVLNEITSGSAIATPTEVRQSLDIE